MKSKTQDKKRLNAVGMRICALFAVLAVVFAAFMTTVPHALASETGNPASVKGKTYKIGTDTTFAPFEYRENGKMTGIDMELIRGIAKEEGFKVEIQSLGFNAALQALSSNQVDVVIAGMSITDERKASYDFSNPYFQSGIQMAVAANNDDVTGYKDLKGRTVVAKTGSEGESYAKQHADKYGYKVTSVDQSSTMYEMVKSGNAVAVFDDYPVLAYGVSQNNGLKIVTPKVPHGEYGMAVNKGMNADLLAAINDGLNKMIASGEYERIVAQYLGKQGAKEQAKSISGMITDNGDDSAEQQKVGFPRTGQTVDAGIADGLEEHAADHVAFLRDRIGARRRVRPDEGFGKQNRRRIGQCVHRGVPRHPDPGVGVLLLLRRAPAHRT